MTEKDYDAGFERWKRDLEAKAAEFDTLKVVGRCAGCNLTKGWDEFCLMPRRDSQRCPQAAIHLYDNGVETIPLCDEHYAYWIADEPSQDDSSPLWDFYKP